MADSPSVFEPSPRSFSDDDGRNIRLENPESIEQRLLFEALLTMYLELDGRCRAMGIPPVREDELREWLGELADGQNLVAWHEDRIIGHAVLLSDGREGHELAIFVHQDYQNAGVGTHLCRTLIADARDAGVSRVWLSVACSNGQAKHLFRSVGFEVVDRSRRQLTMDMHLS